MYCRAGTDVWQRRASLAFRPQDNVSSADLQHLVDLIDTALQAKPHRLKKDDDDTPDDDDTRPESPVS